MGIVEVVLTSILVIVSILLILVILVQSNRSAGMGLFGGGGASQTAFGSSSGDVLTRITGIMAAAFLLITLGLAYIKSQSTSDSAVKKKLNQTEAGLTGGQGEKKDGDTAKDTTNQAEGQNEGGKPEDKKEPENKK